jgi:hypothetical protein
MKPDFALEVGWELETSGAIDKVISGGSRELPPLDRGSL